MTYGRLSYKARHKGYHRLLKVFKLFLDNYPEYVLVIAGDGDMRNELEDLAMTLGISRNVHFTGFLSDEQARQYLSSARFFSLISEIGDACGEGIPLTPLEAMSCGTPIIVGDEDGSIECLQGNVGFAVSPSDLGQALRAMQHLAGLNAERYNQLTHECLSVSRTFFGFTDFSSKLFSALFMTN
jgi:glycosyltransferase involved in cell wall biosynthesis